MVRRYSLEQEEFVRKRLDSGYTNAEIRDEFQRKFPDSHAACSFELNQVSYLKKKNKEAALGFRNPGFKDQVEAINKARAARGMPALGSTKEAGQDTQEQAQNAAAARQPAGPAAAAQAATTTATFRPPTPAASAPPTVPIPGQTTRAPAQAPAHAPIRPSFSPHAGSNPISASAGFHAAPEYHPTPNPLAMQPNTVRPPDIHRCSQGPQASLEPAQNSVASQSPGYGLPRELEHSENTGIAWEQAQSFSNAASAEGALGKRKTTSLPPEAGTSAENGDKRPRLMVEPPDTLGSNTGLVNLGGLKSHSSTAAFLDKQTTGSSSENMALPARMVELYVRDNGSAAVQETSDPTQLDYLPQFSPKPGAPTNTGSQHLPIPTVRNFDRAATIHAIDSFPRIGEKQPQHEGSKQHAVTTTIDKETGVAAAAPMPAGGLPRLPIGPTGNSESNMLLGSIEDEALNQAAIQAGNDVKSMVFSNKDMDRANSGEFNTFRGAFGALKQVPLSGDPLRRVQNASARLNKILYSSSEPAMVRVTATDLGPVVKEAPQPCEEEGQVYYVTTPIPGTDVRPCTAESKCPIPTSVFHFHCHINKTVIFNDMDDFKRAANGYMATVQGLPAEH